ncbi:hypothetical protein [Nitrobacter sp.]|uniref:hypothetical protein n=1 Tax=Nitrobacter sp. TaxID=29420 RepID=UPI0029CAB139|nr:hypothetical protein [Nitrobacter sp.]
MLFDKVLEVCSTTGTGPYSLGGAPAGSSYRALRTKCGDGKPGLYLAQDKGATKWELFFGVLSYGAPDTLTRTYVDSSTGALINWQASDAGYYITSVPPAFALSPLLFGTGYTSRPTWAQTGFRWIDWTAGVASRLIDKLYNGTKDIEIGRYEGVPGIYVPSPRRYWVDRGAAAYTATTDDIGKVHLFDVSASSRALTLPLGSSVDHGFSMHAIGYGSSVNGVVVTPNVADKVDGGAAGATLTVPGGIRFSIEWDGAKSQWRTSYSPASPINGYIFGLTLSNNSGTPNTKVDVSAGKCADATGVLMMSLAAGTIDFTTNGANGLDTGSLANNTTYHVFAIGKSDGTTAYYASTSLTPTLPTGYTLKRRLGSVLTDGSAHIMAFVQTGDFFERRAAPIIDVNGGTLNSTNTQVALSVPSGLNVEADIDFVYSGGGNGIIKIHPGTDAAVTSLSTGTTGWNMSAVSGVSGNGVAGRFRLRTDTSARIRLVTAFNMNPYYIYTNGWIDRRDRDA